MTLSNSEAVAPVIYLSRVSQRLFLALISTTRNKSTQLLIDGGWGVGTAMAVTMGTVIEKFDFDRYLRYVENFNRIVVRPFGLLLSKSHSVSAFLYCVVGWIDS